MSGDMPQTLVTGFQPTEQGRKLLVAYSDSEDEDESKCNISPGEIIEHTEAVVAECLNTLVDKVVKFVAEPTVEKNVATNSVSGRSEANVITTNGLCMVEDRRGNVETSEDSESDSSEESDETSSSSCSSSSSDETESDTNSTMSSDSAGLEEVLNGSMKPNAKAKKATTKNELNLYDLPRIEDLKISVDQDEIRLFGHVFSIVDCLVVVQTIKNVPALNLDTLLFTEDGRSFGQVFDVFGPVSHPLYSIRFNGPEDIASKGITLSLPVYYAPNKAEFTAFVFEEQLRQMKGSDASWKNDDEPPPDKLDYSDDEQERAAKAVRTGKIAKTQSSGECYYNEPSPRKKKFTRSRGARMDYDQSYQPGFRSNQQPVMEQTATYSEIRSPSSSSQVPCYSPIRFPPPPLRQFLQRSPVQSEPASPFNDGPTGHQTEQTCHPTWHMPTPWVPSPPPMPFSSSPPPPPLQSSTLSPPHTLRSFRVPAPPPPPVSHPDGTLSGRPSQLPNPFRDAAISPTPDYRPRFPPVGFKMV